MRLVGSPTVPRQNEWEVGFPVCSLARFTEGFAVPSRSSLGPIAGCVVLVLLLTVLHALLHDPAQRSSSQHFAIGLSREGREITCRRFGLGTGGVLFIGSIHGSEGAGTPLLQALSQRLKSEPRRYRDRPIHVIPIANPDGLASKERFNKRGVDLNRNFPADNRQDSQRFGQEALSEPESQALYTLIHTAQPDIIVSLHQPVACVDYDGPPAAKDLAERMAHACRLPVKKLGSRPGSLGAYFGETLGRPIITLELPPLAPHDAEKLWQRYGTALLEAVAHPYRGKPL